MRGPADPEPLPAPLGGIVLDGSNVIASGSSRAGERLDLAIRWFAAWRRDLHLEIFVDHTTFRRCRPPMQDRLQLAGQFEQGEPQVHVCEPGIDADEPILARAREVNALVVSNDRFFDYDEQRRSVLVVQFVLDRTRFEPGDHATWFRMVGQAVRVPMDVLRDLRANDAS